jgi:hypothetical protein
LEGALSRTTIFWIGIAATAATAATIWIKQTTTTPVVDTVKNCDSPFLTPQVRKALGCDEEK